MAARQDANRERRELSQRIATEVARSRAAGAPPNDQDAARLVAEFEARGGKVTQCEPGDGIRLPEEGSRKG
jgi:hypothetical protein